MTPPTDAERDAEHVAALCATYSITVTFVRRNAHHLAERTVDGRTQRATAATALEAVRKLLSQNNARHTA